MEFKKENLQDLVWDDWDDGEVVEDRIIENSRWSIIHEMVFRHGNKYYESSYSVGATEQQDEAPYEYDDDMIECQEVEKVEVMTYQWEPIR